MSQLSDIEIHDLCVNDRGFKMIDPFEPNQIREIDDGTEIGALIKAISFGCSSYGYDFRLSPKKFRVFHNVHGDVLVDPKNFDERLLQIVEPREDKTGMFFVIPGNNYALAETVEYINVPKNIIAVGLGKSTYARCGLITNVTPMEAAWDGVLTLELANASPAPMKVYANEGICQFIFFEGKIWPRVSYADRKGKYQSQQGLTLALI